VRLDQAAGDVRTQTRAARPTVAAPELCEHARGELGRDARPLSLTVTAAPLDRLNGNGHRTSAVPDRVLEQVAQYLIEFVRISHISGRSGICVRTDPVGTGRGQGGHLPTDCRVQVDHLAMDLQPAGVDPRDVE
jgi:hypothetical protein